jgi:hypothetical protein
MFSGFLVSGSLCGLISLAWLLVQWRAQTRQRLRLTSARTASGGIDVLIQYQPSRTRVGLTARLTLLDADGARLIGGVREERSDRYGVYGAKLLDEANAGRSIQVVLRNLQPDPPSVFAGVFYVDGPEGAPTNIARVRVEVWTEAGPTRLATREATVRAINW